MKHFPANERTELVDATDHLPVHVAAAMVGVTPRAMTRWRREAAPSDDRAVRSAAFQAAQDDERHGTNNGYVNLDCRCGRCTEAHRIAVAERRAARREAA